MAIFKIHSILFYSDKNNRQTQHNIFVDILCSVFSTTNTKKKTSPLKQEILKEARKLNELKENRAAMADYLDSVYASKSVFKPMCNNEYYEMVCPSAYQAMGITPAEVEGNTPYQEMPSYLEQRNNEQYLEMSKTQRNQRAKVEEYYSALQ